ncbi:MAG: methyltransferase domain-containing protein [Chloroflexota bacterium]
MPSNWRYPEQGIIPAPYHHTMLADKNRCDAFRRAIDRKVAPNHTVFEAGAGTGILSYFAAQRARQVYAVEADPEVAALGQALIQRNGLGGRVVYRQGLAQAELPPEPVDVIVCEMMHVALAVEQQLPVMNAIHRELAGRYPNHPYAVIPEAAVNYCQLVQVDFSYYGFQAPFMKLASPYVADSTVAPLSPLSRYLDVNFGLPAEEHIAASCRLEVDAPGQLNAIRILTQAVLSLDASLPAPERLIDWYLHYLLVPLPNPLLVQPGAAFSVELDYDAGCPLDALKLAVHPAQ